MSIKTYSELIEFGTLEERFKYLNLSGAVGEATFGHERWINQHFYSSTEWRRVRHFVIARDLGCDLGLVGHDITGKMYVHHMNPMTYQDLDDGNPTILDPEFLITVSHKTHNAIHYGTEKLLPQPFVERRPGDTKSW